MSTPFQHIVQKENLYYAYIIHKKQDECNEKNDKIIK